MARTASKIPPEELLAALLRHERSPLRDFERQFQGVPGRKYRFDFAYPLRRLAIECDGGTWMAKAGHTTGEGYERDRERDALAACEGWTVLRFTSTQIRRNPDFVLGCIRKLLLTPSEEKRNT